MAESSDQAETSLQLSIYQGSREDFEHSCGQCLIDGNDIEAHGFCIVCNEYLCISCFRAHGKNKASKHHTLLGESELQNLKKADESSTICTDKCPVHANGILIFYCTNHKELCCNDCVIISHENCQKNYIPEKYSEILNSTEYQKALQAINTAQKTVDNVKLVANKEKTQAKTSNEAVLENIRMFEQELHDLLERKLMTIKLEAVTKREANEHTLNRVFDTCNAVSSNLEILRKEILDSKEKKSLAQLFIAIKKTENALKSDEVNDSVKMLRDTKTKYHFERNADMEIMSTLCFGAVKDEGRKSRDAIVNMSKEQMGKSTYIALCIGPTHMSFGISDDNNLDGVMTKQWRTSEHYAKNKVATSLLIDPDGHSVCAFGYEAEPKFDSLIVQGKEAEYFFFRGDYILRLYRNMESGIAFVHDETGKKLSSVFVLSTLLRVLYEEAMDLLKTRYPSFRTKSKVKFVITAPERFATARNVLKEAVDKVDSVVAENCTVLFETEATFAFIHDTKTYYKDEGNPIKQCKEGDRYIVLDARDEMSTITVYEEDKDKTTQLYHKPVTAWAANSLREELENLLSCVFGIEIWQTFKNLYQETYNEMMYGQDKVLLSSRPHKEYTLCIPVELKELVECSPYGTMEELLHNSKIQGNIRVSGLKMRIDYTNLRRCFQPIVSAITSDLHLVLQDKVGLGCGILVMTGGLSNYQVLPYCLKREFPYLQIGKPMQPEIAIVTGAAIIGRSKLGH